jgi:hypothetical protein
VVARWVAEVGLGCVPGCSYLLGSECFLELFMIAPKQDVESPKLDRDCFRFQFIPA